MLIETYNVSHNLEKKKLENKELKEKKKNLFITDFLTRKFIKKLNLENQNLKNHIFLNIKNIFQFYCEYKKEEIIFCLLKLKSKEYILKFITMPNYYNNEKKIKYIENMFIDTTIEKIKIYSLKEFYLKSYKNICF